MTLNAAKRYLKFWRLTLQRSGHRSNRFADDSSSQEILRVLNREDGVDSDSTGKRMVVRLAVKIPMLFEDEAWTFICMMPIKTHSSNRAFLREASEDETKITGVNRRDHHSVKVMNDKSSYSKRQSYTGARQPRDEFLSNKDAAFQAETLEPDSISRVVPIILQVPGLPFVPSLRFDKTARLLSRKS
ncbi:hypothetical protein SCHPADRAFT_895039 [Schizopora paradoxa]|uniref:Uncharacterized protein n=1 Tax=Schizopora paradoxa TaxID=27342 RepID=A0A0H2R6H4_9AGAM|nr:hypothetical protein SCHPADRAFT_895039 [Schizopora paradoxa]